MPAQGDAGEGSPPPRAARDMGCWLPEQRGRLTAQQPRSEAVLQLAVHAGPCTGAPCRLPTPRLASTWPGLAVRCPPPPTLAAGPQQHASPAPQIICSCPASQPAACHLHPSIHAPATHRTGRPCAPLPPPPAHLPQVGREGHYFAAVGVLQPLEDDGCVQAAAIREHDLLHLALGTPGGRSRPHAGRPCHAAARVSMGASGDPCAGECRGTCAGIQEGSQCGGLASRSRGCDRSAGPACAPCRQRCWRRSIDP